MIIGAGSRFEFTPKEGIVHVTTLIISAAMALALAAPAAAQSQDVDLTGADGTNLKATYMSPGRPGPAMLLVHQCNMDRTSWSGIASQLVDAGVHVLALDLRGFGDSGGQSLRESGFPAFMQKSPGDVDVAFDYLASQSGVDGMRVAAGGASCGAMLTADLAPAGEGADAPVRAAERRRRREHGVVAGARGVRRRGDGRYGDWPTRYGVRSTAPAIRAPPRRSTTAPSTGCRCSRTWRRRRRSRCSPPRRRADKNPDLEPALVSWLKGELLSN